MPSPDTHDTHNQTIFDATPPLLKSLSLTRIGALHRAGPAAVVAAQRRRRRVAARCGRRARGAADGPASDCSSLSNVWKRTMRRSRSSSARDGIGRLTSTPPERRVGRFRGSDGAGSSAAGGTAAAAAAAGAGKRADAAARAAARASSAADACHAAAAERAVAPPGPRYFLCFETPVSLTWTVQPGGSGL